MSTISVPVDAGVSYRPDIDGLRAIAIIAVVAYHVGVPGFSGGFVGVDVFFCISGFLIASILLRDIDAGTFSFRRFYARRFRRILPALFTVIGIAYLLALVLLTPGELVDLSKSGVGAVLGVSNFYFHSATGYFAPAAESHPFLMTWSLGVEEQFYLVLPATLLLVRRLGSVERFLCLSGLALVSLVLSAVLTPTLPSLAFYLLPCRLWELGVGVLLALATRIRPLSSLPTWLAELSSLAGFTLVALSIAYFDEATPMPGLAAIAPVFGTALLLLAPGGQVNRRLLSSKPFVFVGLISYSWYLWHWPLLSLARVVAASDITLAKAGGIGVLSFLIAIASWRFVETPFRRPLTHDGPTLARYAWLATGLTCTLVVAILTGGLPNRVSPEAAPDSTPARLSVGCMLDFGQTALWLAPQCVESGRAVIALVGDSHAHVLAQPLGRWARDHGLGFAEFTKVGCPLLEGVTKLRSGHPKQPAECELFQSRVIAELLHRPEITTVHIAGYWSNGLREGDPSSYAPAGLAARASASGGAALLEAGLASVVKTLTAAGKAVVVYQDVPSFPFDPVGRVNLTYMPARRALARLLGDDFEAASSAGAHVSARARPDPAREFVERAVAGSGASLLDPRSVLCEGVACCYREGPHLYYLDPDHLSRAGARKVITGLGYRSNPS